MIGNLFITMSIAGVALCWRSPAKFWRCVQEDGKEPHAIVQVCLDRVRDKQSVITEIVMNSQ